MMLKGRMDTLPGGGSKVVNAPAGLRIKPKTWGGLPVKEYVPTISPFPLMPAGIVALAPGTSKVVMVVAWPYPRPGIRKVRRQRRFMNIEGDLEINIR